MKTPCQRVSLSAFILLTSCCLLLGQTVPTMTAHFIKVGQADATLLEFPCGVVLIDAGAQDDAFAEHLVQYLDSFFQTNPGFSNTLQAVFITHPHSDHTSALKLVAQHCTVKRFIENGQNTGSGIANVKWMRAYARTNNIAVREILNSEVMSGGNHKGVTDEIIDPLKCDKCDPVITVFSGQWDNDPDWTASQLNNKNDHSLVIRVDFGQSAFFFTGDLEEEAINSLLEYYGPADNCSNLFGADVWHVGHHGSQNATTEELLNAIHPALAVISVGHWDWGKDGTDRFTTWYYGHPRKTAVQMLAAHISGNRDGARRPKVATAAKTFSSMQVKKKIYATDWDGDVLVRASLDHNVQVSFAE